MATLSMRPFCETPTTLEGLKAALAAPLEDRLPVSKSRYEMLQLRLGDRAPGMFVVDEGDVSAIASLVLDEPVSAGMELPLCDLCFRHFWRVVLRSRNCYVGGISWETTRFSVDSPEVFLQCFSRLVFKTETRLGRENLEPAWQDLARKLSSLDAACYGPFDWILGAAIASGRVHFGAFSRTKPCEFLFRELDLEHTMDRYELLRCSVNLLRVALSWSPVFSDLGLQVSMPYRTYRRASYGPGNAIKREIFVMDGVVTKQIWPWQLHEDCGFTTLQAVKQAYEVRHPNLMAGQVEVEEDTFSVEMEVLGQSSSFLMPDELPKAILDVLRGLEALHEMGLVHRDLKWKNVVYVRKQGLWKIIDFETVWQVDQVPEGYSADWLQDAVDSDGKFTIFSDLRMVADMVRSQDPMGREISRKLARDLYPSTAAALEDVERWVYSSSPNKRIRTSFDQSSRPE